MKFFYVSEKIFEISFKEEVSFCVIGLSEMSEKIILQNRVFERVMVPVEM